VNLAWIVPRSGKPQSRNVHAKDRAKLVREGYGRYKLEWIDGAGNKREADLYAQRIPAGAELLEAARGLFGATGKTGLRLLDRAGKVVTK
jgi:hypothetical protein